MYPGAHAITDPDRPAVIQAATGETLTYRQLDDDSVRIAQLLRARGVATGDTIAVLMDNDVRYLSVCWAAQRSGLRYVPVNWHLTADEVRYVVDDCGARTLIANAGCAELAAEVRRGSGRATVALATGPPIAGFDDLDDALREQPGGHLDDETSGSDMVYSSGTTGRPKGGRRPLSGRHPGDVPLAALSFYRLFGFHAGMTYLTPGAPLYHAAPLRFAMAVHRFGGTNLVMDRFDPAGALAAVERWRVTHSQWVPTMFARLLRLPEDVRTGYDLSSHEAAIHSAAPCPAGIKQAMIDWWGPIVEEYYGASEGGLLTYLSSSEWIDHRGSVGRPIVGNVHILDDEGRELRPGEPGLVYAEAGRPVDYLNDPDKTRRAHSPQGWATVGDIGYVDDDGYLYLSDRRDDLIISGGVNVYPLEAENVLMEHPDVADVAVIGVPHDELGEEVKAVVELVDGAAAPPPSVEATLIAHCRAHLAAFKCPRSVDVVSELPRAPSGKLYKRRLRARYWPVESDGLLRSEVGTR